MAELLHTFVWGSLDLLLRVFLSTVHAIVEDSFIFLALGASFLWIVGYRIVWAAFITLLLTGMAGLLVRRYRL